MPTVIRYIDDGSVQNLLKAITPNPNKANTDIRGVSDQE